LQAGIWNHFIEVTVSLYHAHSSSVADEWVYRIIIGERSKLKKVRAPNGNSTTLMVPQAMASENGVCQSVTNRGFSLAINS